MKKILMTVLVLWVLLGAVNNLDGEAQDQKALQTGHKEIYAALANGQFQKTLTLTEAAMQKEGYTMDLMHLKYDALIGLNRLSDALVFIDEAIKKTGESEPLVSARYNILRMQKNLPEALKAARRKYQLAKEKSPWDCMAVMHVLLEMRSKDEALDWLQEAVERGFISYRILSDKRYDLLKNEKRLYEIIDSIKLSIGLGSPARNFQVQLLNGDLYNLGRQKGKVVLAAFWAIWCDGCLRDMPELKRTWDMFKNRGFEIVGISLDTDKSKTETYIKEHKLDWYHACSEKGWEDQAVRRYSLNSLPSYWLVDKKGILRSVDLKGQELRKAVAALLAE